MIFCFHMMYETSELCDEREKLTNQMRFVY